MFAKMQKLEEIYKIFTENLQNIYKHLQTCKKLEEIYKIFTENLQNIYEIFFKNAKNSGKLTK